MLLPILLPSRPPREHPRPDRDLVPGSGADLGPDQSPNRGAEQGPQYLTAPSLPVAIRVGD